MTSPLSDFAANQPQPTLAAAEHLLTVFKPYRRTQIAEMADFEYGMDLHGVSISEADRKAGSPQPGDKIARNPANHEDKWLVAADYFATNFESVDGPSPELARLEADNARLAALAKQNEQRAVLAEQGWQTTLLKYAKPTEHRPDHAVLVSIANTMESVLAELRRSNSVAHEGAVSSVQVEETAKGPRVTVKLYAGSVAPVEEAIEDFGRAFRLAQEGQMRAWEATVAQLAEAKSA